MTTPGVLRAIAELVPGKRVKVVIRGREHSLPLAPEPGPQSGEAPDIAKEILERDARTLATVEGAIAEFRGLSGKMDATSGAINDALARLSNGQGAIADGIKVVAATLARPVRPVYDDRGKLVGAVRDGK